MTTSITDVSDADPGEPAGEAPDYARLTNFRDLGGLAVTGGGVTRHGVLFRSESLEFASAADATHLREVMGLRTIVDLRATITAEAGGRGLLGVHIDGVTPIDYLPLPCTDVGVTPDSRPAFYVDLLATQGAAFATLARRFAAGTLSPLIVHCQLGCDRTGTVIAMLLRLAGVRDDEICADYARSRGGSPAIRFRAEAIRRAEGLEPLPDTFYAAWDNVPEIMAETLALVDARWGSMHGWAAEHGIEPAEIAALRAVLVDG